MSGETVTSNALQFTNDNKHAYGYSGVIAVNNNETSLLLFQTNSEYLNAQISMFNGSGSGDDFLYKIYFNDIVVVDTYANSSNVEPTYFNPIRIIIPPFTTVKITADNVSGSSARNHTAIVTAKVGMAPRVGNLVE